MTTETRPTVVDLFAGCGGMSLGLEAAGFDIACGVEFDAIHSLVHHFNFPYSASICKDISELREEEILLSLQKKDYGSAVDVVVGGPPCQGFSHIGKRNVDDSRNKLVFQYLRIIDAIKPKYFIFENVPGIATGNHKVFLNELIEEFDKVGYGVVLPYKVLNSADFGVPQARKRLILLGYRFDMEPPQYPDPTHSRMKIDAPSDLFVNKHLHVGSFEAIGDLESEAISIGKDRGIDAKNKVYEGLIESFDFDPSGEFSLCHKRTLDHVIWGHIGSKHMKKSIERFGATLPGVNEKVSRFYKLHPKFPCNTIRAGTASDRGAHTAPRPIHYFHPRCISLREAARLHTFPDWFQFHRTIWHGFREIGNAVAPLFAKKLGEEIMKKLSVDTQSLEIRTLPAGDMRLLTYNMTAASKFWNVADDIIPKRKRLTG